jgi:probable rRNA maturation factor
MLSQKLNKKYRGIDKPTNILTFPLGENEGEIFINLSRAQKGASRFNQNTKSFIGFLFIHGLLHLKGYPHGSTMESKERKICRKFNI